ncbi:hypothetical protein SEVIR_7G187550v4 [Setaria viridis]
MYTVTVRTDAARDSSLDWMQVQLQICRILNRNVTVYEFQRSTTSIHKERRDLPTVLVRSRKDPRSPKMRVSFFRLLALPPVRRITDGRMGSTGPLTDGRITEGRLPSGPSPSTNACVLGDPRPPCRYH